MEIFVFIFISLKTLPKFAALFKDMQKGVCFLKLPSSGSDILIGLSKLIILKQILQASLGIAFNPKKKLILGIYRNDILESWLGTDGFTPCIQCIDKENGSSENLLLHTT